MKNCVFAAIIMALILLQACSKNGVTPNPGPTPNPTEFTMDSITAPDNFTYNTTSNVKVTINAVDPNGISIPNTLFKVYAKNGSDTLLLQTLFTDASGYAETGVILPSNIDSLMFKSYYIGIPSGIVLPIVGTTVSLDYSRFNAVSISNYRSLKSSSTPIKFVVGKTTFVTLSGFDNNGVPTNLISPRDAVPSGMLTNINYTLPEGVSVPQHNAYLLDPNKKTNITIDALADVWVTFVHEGAGYRNVLGFFKYDINNPPKKTTDIDSVKIIFPNTSYYNSGGGLHSGDKVYIGRYPAGTGIGWVCISDGFRNGTITLNNWNWILYSISTLNPQGANANLNQQTLLLYDNVDEKVLLTFEDIERDKGGDQDFNDVVYYITATPVTSVNTGNLNPLKITPTTDTDGDGVPDIYDEYPNDPNKAFNNWYPSKTGFGTIAYEDLWPAKGDYDMNDHVVNYQINQITNATNKVVEVNGKLVLSAMGASYHNGFGIALGIPNSSVQLATTTFKGKTGSLLKHGLTTLSGNGLETPVNNPYNGVQQEAVYIVYDDGYDILPYAGGGNGVNTTIGSTYVTPDTISFKISMATPQDYYNMGTPPYNPFIFVNQDRTREVHLENYVPTGKADTKYFMTAQDYSSVAKKRYYRTYKNLPWAILFPTSFAYPTETTPIIKAYNYFAPWAQSGGNVHPDWFSNTASGYRNTSNIYHK